MRLVVGVEDLILDPSDRADRHSLVLRPRSNQADVIMLADSAPLPACPPNAAMNNNPIALSTILETINLYSRSRGRR